MPIFQTATGTELFYRTAGDAATGTALFVHPFMHDGTIWLDQLQGLRDLRRCIAIDMRGHGRSDPNPNPHIVDQEHIADLVEFVDSIDGRIDLVGMAFGGNMCAAVYEQRPDRIGSLTMISSNFLPTEPDAAGRRYTAELARIATVEDKGIVFRRWLEYIMSPNASLFAKARYRSVLERTPTETMVAFLGGFVIEPRPDLPAKLLLPVLIPVGADDGIIQLDGALSEIPNLRVDRLEAAGRLLPIEAPEALNMSLRNFWQSLA
jgi:pimeloyl-ACP methyl ester carboxylesterase